jgi:hypothetical protein
MPLNRVRGLRISSAGEILKQKRRTIKVYGAFVLYLGSLGSFGCSFSFRPPLFHHFRNALLSRGAEPTTATPPTPAIPEAGLPAAPAVRTFQSSNGLLQTVSFIS